MFLVPAKDFYIYPQVKKGKKTRYDARLYLPEQVDKRIGKLPNAYYYPAEIDEEGRLRVDFSGPMTPESEELAGSEHGMEE